MGTERRRKGPTRFPLSKERGGVQPKKGFPPNRRDSSRFIWVSCLEGTLVSFLNKDTKKTTFHFVGFLLETDLSAKQRLNRDQHRGARLASVRAGKGDAFSSGAPLSCRPTARSWEEKGLPSLEQSKPLHVWSKEEMWHLVLGWLTPHLPNQPNTNSPAINRTTD